MLHVVHERLNRRLSQWEYVSSAEYSGEILRHLERMLYMRPNSYPFAFCERGLPTVMTASHELAEQYQQYNARYGISWRTKAEITSKCMELLVLPDAGALVPQPALTKLLRNMPEGDVHGIRAVYWFGRKKTDGGRTAMEEMNLQMQQMKLRLDTHYLQAMSKAFLSTRQS